MAWLLEAARPLLAARLGGPPERPESPFCQVDDFGVTSCDKDDRGLPRPIGEPQASAEVSPTVGVTFEPERGSPWPPVGEVRNGKVIEPPLSPAEPNGRLTSYTRDVYLPAPEGGASSPGSDRLARASLFGIRPE